eukprot:CAMPEP_0173347906 /NCGR_PEP_ID=MMETSP1144-20121109/13421_1 /TAXON_ID=483371 /ORGANISM="non described non described, Strain CCMP2298" /LENGTH=222 /DNA_ID=CAMNT_0014295459 /DNA_START=97 /DNA_END=765 /DNA_ORIENTATION=-
MSTGVMSTLASRAASVKFGNQVSARYNLLLGSGSSTRKQILLENGFNFRVVKADIDEKAIGDRSKNAEDLVTLLACEKAKAIQKKLTNTQPDDLLLTADQVVLFDGKILEKPVDLAEARMFIDRYSGRSCMTVGSLMLTKPYSGQQVMGVDTATIHFGQIPRDVVDAILAEGECVHCAGGLMVEHPLLQPHIRSLEGTQESLMGLSVELLHSLLHEIGALEK